MKNLIYKKFNILEIVLILSPIIDILTSVSQRTLNIDISLGLIIRSFLLFFMTMFTLVKSSYKYKKITISYLAMFILYSIFFMVNVYINKGSSYILAEAKGLIKAFYFPICIITLLNYVETKDYKIDLKLLFFVMIEYILLLFLPSILNLGYESYAEDKIGTIGWFFSANEISSIFSILIVLIVFSYKYIKNIAVYFGLIIVSFYTVLQIGTKMPAVSAIIAIIAFLMFYLIQYISTKDKNYIKSLCAGVGLICVFSVIFITSPVMKNFDIYKNFLIATRDKQEVVESSADPAPENVIENSEENITISVDNDENQNNVKQEQSQEQTKEKIEDENLTNDEIATIIHSGRLETMSNINIKFGNSNIITKIIGLGRIDIENNDEYLIETDYFDILYNFGILGFIIYFLPAIIIAVIVIKRVIKNKIILLLKDDYKFCYIIIILNGLICAVAGHTLVAPAVSIYISVILIQLFREYESKEII